MIVTVDAVGRLLSARGDHDHVLSEGYACIKGLETPAIHNSPERLLHPLKRKADGTFMRLPLEDALDEIAQKLRVIIDRDGPDAVALFRGTQNYSNGAASYMVRYFMQAIGSPCFFSTMTIDQSAKWVTDERLGTWAAGRHRLETADVFMAFGYNPLLSVQGGYGFYVNNPAKRMREVKARGLKLIVIDPRRTETARFADIHLQPLPGEDATIAAGMLRLILAEGWDDTAFWTRWAPGVPALRDAVAPFTPDYVARRARIPEELFRAAVKIFAQESRRGITMTGTGPDMAMHSNLANHLIESLNVVCGRFPREGEAVANTGVLEPLKVRRAEARSPRRSWEKGHKSRIRNTGQLMGEMMCGVLPDEILMPGAGQIKSLFCVAGNPASVFPDQRKTVAALRALELLVTMDSMMTNTAKLSHYILPPKLMFERPDGPQIWETVSSPKPFVQYTPAVASPPAGSEVCDEWYPFWGIAKRLDLPIVFNGAPLDMDTPPSSDHLLDLITREAQVPLSEVRKHPGGFTRASVPATIQPPRPDCTGAFDMAPADVVAEIAELVREPFSDADVGGFTHRLAVRRMREVLNSSFREVPAIRRRVPFNPVHMHPRDLTSLGLTDGDAVYIVSEHGRIAAIVKVDTTLRAGVVTMSHGWGGLPDEGKGYEEEGANTNLLVSLDKDVQTINAMARFSAIPVRIEKANAQALANDMPMEGAALDGGSQKRVARGH
ncbi:MAG: nitrate reductase [Rhodospirillaceae bacterium]|nr:MAG: nitrate reductase [Rhodospirillaceae bacterium]